MVVSNWSIRHSVTIYVLIVVLSISGWVAYQALPREASPDVKIPFVMVTTPYFGVSPADIETLVTDPMEDELEQLKDVREIRSTSAEGASIVSIEFDPDVVIDDALQKIRERVDAAMSELPPDAEDPIITEISFSEFPVILVNISGDVGLVTLKRVAEEVQDEIERIPGILEVALTGAVDREIYVEAEPDLLDFYNVSLNDLTLALQAENLNMPGGSVNLGELNYLVRVPGEFESVTEIESIVIKYEEGQPILVRDVAQVVDGYEEESTFSRLNGLQSVSLSISRRSGENIIRITDEVKAIVEQAHARYGDHLDFTTTADVSNDIRSQLAELENNILTGLVLVIAILLFFMGGLRNALFVAIAIPMSMLISFSVLSVMGITLNIVVLFSLVLALGMLVDNGIVVVENSYRHAAMGKPIAQAAMDGTAEIAWPVISSTLTTVVAFLPMVWWPGIMGEFMSFLPMTVIIVLTSSLFVALVVNPVLCATLMKVKPQKNTRNTGDDEWDALPDNFFYGIFERFLTFFVRRRWIVLLGMPALFVVTMMLYGKYNAGMEFFPATSPERAVINLTLPDGTDVDASDAVVRRVEAMISENPDIEQWVAGVGAGNGNQMDFGSGGTAPHRSQITVDFVDFDDRSIPAQQTIEQLREALQALPGVESEIVSEENGPPSGAPVNLELVGPDYAELGRLAALASEIIATVPGVTDLKDDYESGRPEIVVEVDRAEAARLGVSTSAVAATVRAAIAGTEASTFRDDDDEYDIVVRLEEGHRDSVEDIESLTVTNADGELIALTEVASVSLGRAFGSIRHIDGDRVVTVGSDVADGFNDFAVLAAVQEAMAEQMQIPGGYEVRWTGQNQDQAESQAFLGRAMMIALFLIALTLVTQFNSLSQTLIIMTSVILSLMGVFWILMIRQMPFNLIMTGIGVISLAGVVVNNAIVLIDYTNQLRDRGMAISRAVVQAAMVRLRPVLLTAGTTALGLLPTVLGYNLDMRAALGNLTGLVTRSGAEWTPILTFGGRSVEMWGPMANSIIAGLFVATVLTLVVVPVLYSFLHDLTGAIGRFFGRIGGMFRRANASDAEVEAPAAGE